MTPVFNVGIVFHKTIPTTYGLNCGSHCDLLRDRILGVTAKNLRMRADFSNNALLLLSAAASSTKCLILVESFPLVSSFFGTYLFSHYASLGRILLHTPQVYRTYYISQTDHRRGSIYDCKFWGLQIRGAKFVSAVSSGRGSFFRINVIKEFRQVLLKSRQDRKHQLAYLRVSSFRTTKFQDVAPFSEIGCHNDFCL